MKKFVTLFADSAREFKKVRTLTMCGLLAALAFVLNSASIQLGPYIKIGFSGVPNEIVDFMFGPVTGAIFSGTMDVLKFIVKPTGPWIPGLTLDAFLAGLIYGVFMYKKPIRLWRIAAAKLVVTVFINVILATYWLSQVYGAGYMAALPNRVIKNIVMWPINTLVTFLVLKLLERAGIFRSFGIYQTSGKTKEQAIKDKAMEGMTSEDNAFEQIDMG